MEGFRPFQENQQSYESVRKFGYGLFAQNVRDQNPVLSPISAYLALSMAGCGADGRTKEEFYNVLGKDMIAQTINMMNTIPAEGDRLKLSFANSAWMDVKFFLNDTWLSAIKCLINAEAFQTSLFTADTMKIMNHWIEMKTNGMIVNALEEPLDPQTNFALFSTVYFKGDWVYPFAGHETHKEAFYLDDGQNAVQADLMCLRAYELDCISDNFTEGAILPYLSDGDDDRQLAFVALKPKGNEKIRNICSRLDGEVVKNLLASRQKVKIDLKLPKFEVTFDQILNRSLANMGLIHCFDRSRANFTPIGRNLRNGDGLYIDFVRQKAKIVVDEKGTEAAAVSGAPVSASAAQKELCFNEPFLYMIMDMDNEIPLFVGILDDPTAKR